MDNGLRHQSLCIFTLTALVLPQLSLLLATCPLPAAERISRPEDPATNFYPPAISGDGATVAYVSTASSPDGFLFTQPVIVNRATGARQHLSPLAGTSWAGVEATNLSLSANGRWLAFESTGRYSANAGQFPQVYLFDRTTGAVRLVSHGTAGAVPNGGSDQASISPDGRWIAFRSFATNLGANPTEYQDLFLYDQVDDRTIALDFSAHFQRQ
jgi:Tol biopolymer transport system component